LTSNSRAFTTKKQTFSVEIDRVGIVSGIFLCQPGPMSPPTGSLIPQRPAMTMMKPAVKKMSSLGMAARAPYGRLVGYYRYPAGAALTGINSRRSVSTSV
jgi:hypothetical protein